MFESLDHFEIDEIEVFVHITQSTFNIANVSLGSFGLSGIHWQQTLLMGLVRKRPTEVTHPQATFWRPTTKVCTTLQHKI